MIQRPTDIGGFEFAVLAGLRAGQLSRGCTPRVMCAHKIAFTAQLEVARGVIVRQVKGDPGDIRLAP